jgi:hypothetical protein
MTLGERLYDILRNNGLRGLNSAPWSALAPSTRTLYEIAAGKWSEVPEGWPPGDWSDKRNPVGVSYVDVAIEEEAGWRAIAQTTGGLTRAAAERWAARFAWVFAGHPVQRPTIDREALAKVLRDTRHDGQEIAPWEEATEHQRERWFTVADEAIRLLTSDTPTEIEKLTRERDGARADLKRWQDKVERLEVLMDEHDAPPREGWSTYERVRWFIEKADFGSSIDVPSDDPRDHTLDRLDRISDEVIGWACNWPEGNQHHDRNAAAAKKVADSMSSRIEPGEGLTVELCIYAMLHHLRVSRDAAGHWQVIADVARQIDREYRGTGGPGMHDSDLVDVIAKMLRDFPKVARERNDFKRALDVALDDMKRAADELLIPIPEPGTDLARVLAANSILRRERDRAARERDEALRLQHQVDAANQELPKLDRRIKALEFSLKDTRLDRDAANLEARCRAAEVEILKGQLKVVEASNRAHVSTISCLEAERDRLEEKLDTTTLARIKARVKRVLHG